MSTNYLKLTIGILVWLFALSNVSAAEEYALGTYKAYIGSEDLQSSRGVRLTNAAQILRQDRANVHKFGVVHPGDDTRADGDHWFFQPAAREAMEGMLKNGGGIRSEVARKIVTGGVHVLVTIYAIDGNFTSLRIKIIK